MTEYTHRIIMVVKATAAANANSASKLVDKIGGERTFAVPRARPANPTVPVAYWCNWALTKRQVRELKDHLLSRGFAADELRESKKTGFAAGSNKKMMIFLCTGTTDNRNGIINWLQ